MNEQEATLCAGCGLTLGDSAAWVTALKIFRQCCRFVRWYPAAISLWGVGLIYAAASVLCVLTLPQLHEIGDRLGARVTFQSIFLDASIALLCVVAWWMMKRQTKAGLTIGAIAALIALLIILYVWCSTIGTRFWNPSPIEPLLTWTPLLYSVAYALSRRNHKSP